MTPIIPLTIPIKIIIVQMIQYISKDTVTNQMRVARMKKGKIVWKTS